MSVVQGQFYKNKTNSQLFRICHVSYAHRCVAYVDWNIVLNKTHQKKPLVCSIEEVVGGILNKEWILDKGPQLSPLITKSDKALIDDGRISWIEKRDVQYRNIQPLTNDQFIEKHLYENGIRKHVLQLIESSDWKSEGAFYNALNKYITFGMSVVVK
jgi:putative transposase